MKSMFETKNAVIAAAFSAAVMAIGCAGPTLKTEQATSGIRAAQEAGASEVPQASLHLQLAKEGLENAKVLSSNGQAEKADSMLMRAEADAALAVALSREDAQIAEAAEAVERVRNLRADNQSGVK